MVSINSIMHKSKKLLSEIILAGGSEREITGVDITPRRLTLIVKLSKYGFFKKSCSLSPSLTFEVQQERHNLRLPKYLSSIRW